MDWQWILGGAVAASFVAAMMGREVEQEELKARVQRRDAGERWVRGKVEVDVWPEGRMPGTATTGAEHMEARGAAKGRITHVSVPTLTVWPADGVAGGKRAAVLILPGGGYNNLSNDLEGTEVAAWLNGLGMTAVILKYRVPRNREGAFMDIQRAMKLVRSRAEEWGIDAGRVGGLGFSAGGHLLARLSTGYGSEGYRGVDGADGLSCRPDFAMLMYPAYLEVAGVVVRELPVNERVPATLLMVAEDDVEFVPSSKAYFAALQGAGVAAEFHLFPDGGHGFGMRSKRSAEVWPRLAEAWMRKQGVLR